MSAALMVQDVIHGPLLAWFRAITAEANETFAIDAVYKWPTIGIPDRHWPILIKLASATPEELFEANRLARQGAAA